MHFSQLETSTAMLNLSRKSDSNIQAGLLASIGTDGKVVLASATNSNVLGVVLGVLGEDNRVGNCHSIATQGTNISCQVAGDYVVGNDAFLDEATGKVSATGNVVVGKFCQAKQVVGGVAVGFIHRV